MTIIIWGTVIAAVITLAVGKHATDRWHIDRAAEEEAAKHPSQLQRNAHRTYPIQPFAAFTTCPGCGTTGCFTWELPPAPPTKPPAKPARDEPAEAIDHLIRQAYGAHSNHGVLWGGRTFYSINTVRPNEPPPDATTCDVIRTCPNCDARWGER